MKIVYKLEISLLAVIVAITTMLYLHYNFSKKNYNESVNNTIYYTIDKIKSDIEKANSIVSLVFDFKYEMFKKIHLEAQKKLKENPNIDLNKLKNELDKTLAKSLVKTEVFLINKEYMIYDTTIEKDLNLNLSQFIGAKVNIDEVRNDKNKIIIDKPSYDILTKKYNTYSYSLLNEKKGIVLELAFADELLNKIKEEMNKIVLKNSIVKEYDLFEDYNTYTINLTKHTVIESQTKQEFVHALIAKQSEFDGKIIKNSTNHSYEIEENGKTFKIFYTKIKDEKLSSNKSNNYVLKLKVDISNYKQTLDELYILFILSIVAMVILLVLVIVFVRYSLLNPMDKEILRQKNELKQYSLELEQKVQIELEKSRIRDQKILEQSRFAQMGEMISMLAHQWRQPLGTISTTSISIETKLSLGKFDLSKEEGRVSFKEFLFEKLRNINEYVQSLSTTIDEFRNFFKIDTNKELVAVDEPIKKGLKLIATSFEKKGISLETDFGMNEKLFLYKNEFLQVILNIVKNSEDNFLDKKIVNGVITITTKKENNYCLIEIEDNGGGISQEILPKIFDPYFSTKDEKNGTGLGLYMSKIIIEEHHLGELIAKNTQNGVVFSIRLPLKNS